MLPLPTSPSERTLLELTETIESRLIALWLDHLSNNRDLSELLDWHWNNLSMWQPVDYPLLGIHSANGIVYYLDQPVNFSINDDQFNERGCGVRVEIPQAYHCHPFAQHCHDQIQQKLLGILKELRRE